MIRGGRTDGGRRRKGKEGENARRMLELEGPTSGFAGGARGLLSFFFLTHATEKEIETGHGMIAEFWKQKIRGIVIIIILI